MEMCPAGVSTRRVDGTGRLPWGGRMPSQTPSDRLEHVCAGIDGWGKRPLGGRMAVRVRGRRVAQAFPGRVRRVDARMRRNPLRHRERMVDPPLSGHVPDR